MLVEEGFGVDEQIDFLLPVVQKTRSNVGLREKPLLVGHSVSAADQMEDAPRILSSGVRMVLLEQVLCHRMPAAKACHAKESRCVLDDPLHPAMPLFS